MTSHSDNGWHLLHSARHLILTWWPQATIFKTSHPLYWTSYPLYLCHHMHIIDDTTQTEFLRSHLLYLMTSYPLYMTSQPLNVCHHTHTFNDITPFVYRTSYPLYVYYHIHSIKDHVHILWHHTRFLWHHMYFIHDINSIISEKNSNIWHQTPGNTNVISAISHTVSNTTSTVSVSPNRGYQLYHTTLCMT